MSKHHGMKMRRMERLLEVAKRIPPKQFDMKFWLRADFTADAPKGDYEPGTVLTCKPGALPNGHLCNTAACLAGWAATDPALRRAGLRLRVATDDEFSVFGEKRDVFGLPVFGEETDTDALMTCFGVNRSAEAKLFRQTEQSGASGKRHMIAEIKRVMARPELYGAEA